MLEDGTVIRGTGFGAEKEALGEIVFNTSMTGYVESLTDPSYNGQILMSTYPLIGNCNVHPEWFESERIWAEGFVVKELCEHPSHWRGIKTLDEFLREFDVPGIAGVDTRALVVKIREHGSMKSGLVTYKGQEPDVRGLLEMVRQQPGISGQDLASETTRKEMAVFNGGGKPKVVLIDFGVKRSVIEGLVKRGASVIAVPAMTKSAQIKALGANGIVLSSGPGDPALTKAQETAKQLMEKYPMIGIGLGNQILALAAGAKIFRLKFGHRGSNHPVRDLRRKKIYITSQNHGFAVDAQSLRWTGFEVSGINCNDNTVEGICHTELPIFGFEYYPTWDAECLLDDFVKLLKAG